MNNKNIIKLNESDINNMVMEAMNEVSWRLSRSAYNKHNGSEFMLYMLSGKIENIIEFIEDENPDKLENPIKQNVYNFLNLLNKYKEYFDKKVSQIEKFNQHSTEGFTNEFGKSPRDVENELGDKEDYLFNKYIDSDDTQSYRNELDDLENSNEQQALNHYYGY